MKTKFSLLKKVAVITGAGSGIGKAIAITFAEQGADINILDIDLKSANKTVEDIENKGFNATAYRCDVSDINEVTGIIKEINKSNSIDILVNNAGIANVGNLEACEEKDLDLLYEINIKGIYNCSKACIPIMKNNSNGGVILNIASIAASVGLNDRFGYSMTKGAVLSMTYSIAKDYIDFKIRCNCISPARVNTPFVDGFIKKNYPGKEKEMFEYLSKTQPIGRMGQPEEIADLALFLCSDESSFITGSNYSIDGGFIKLNSK
ncbi:MAG: short-chain dehydrogenase [Candidatus Marinimicrobia bacterium]|nr:short-chain dehydrogenase [Candidatus Neomarinimicrobiota bacterium]